LRRSGSQSFSAGQIFAFRRIQCLVFFSETIEFQEKYPPFKPQIGRKKTTKIGKRHLVGQGSLKLKIHCFARSRRWPIFHFSANRRFKGCVCFLKFQRFQKYNQKLNTTKNKNLSSGGTWKALSPQCIVSQFRLFAGGR